MDKMEPSKSNNQLFGKIADLLAEARKFVVKSVNQTIVRTYFKVGRLIVEDEQQGNERAGYGKTVLKNGIKSQRSWRRAELSSCEAG